MLPISCLLFESINGWVIEAVDVYFLLMCIGRCTSDQLDNIVFDIFIFMTFFQKQAVSTPSQLVFLHFCQSGEGIFCICLNA